MKNIFVILILLLMTISLQANLRATTSISPPQCPAGQEYVRISLFKYGCRDK